MFSNIINSSTHTYEVIEARLTKDRTEWFVEVRVKWRFSRKALVRRFVGKGLAWYELVDEHQFGAGVHVPYLNAIVSLRSHEMLIAPLRAVS